MLIFLVLLVLPLQVEPGRAPLNFFGGIKADIGQLPYVVAIRVKLDPDTDECLHQDKPDKSQLACAGTVMSPKWVLSVADCVEDEDKRRDLEMIVGQANLGNPNFNRQCTPVNKVVEHKTYVDMVSEDKNEKPENIALYRAQKTLLFYDVVRQVVLPKEGTYPGPYEGEATMGGWGNDPEKEDSRVPSILQYADTYTAPLRDCTDYYRKTELVDQINDKNLCFKSKNSEIIFSRFNRGAPIVDRGELLGIITVAPSEHQKATFAAAVDTSLHVKFVKHYVTDIYVYHTGIC